MGAGGAGGFVVGRGLTQRAGQQQVRQAIEIPLDHRPLIAQTGHVQLRTPPRTGQPDGGGNEYQGNQEQVEPVEQRQRTVLHRHKAHAQDDQGQNEQQDDNRRGRAPGRRSDVAIETRQGCIERF